MRWLILLLLLGLVGATSKDLCSVREFYGIAYTVHNPSERHQQMSAWLTKHKSLCKSSDMTVIWNNLSEWAGAADSAELRHKVIQGYKNALEREKK
jgi:predicted restriction endonuclease